MLSSTKSKEWQKQTKLWEWERETEHFKLLFGSSTITTTTFAAIFIYMD